MAVDITTKLHKAADKVWRAFLKFGPVDDGRPEGDEFDIALLELQTTSKLTKRQTEAERRALVDIVNAADETGGSGHSRLREAIERARKVLSETNMLVEAMGEVDGEAKWK